MNILNAVTNTRKISSQVVNVIITPHTNEGKGNESKN